MGLVQKNTITRDYLARIIKRETGVGVSKSSKVVDDFFQAILTFVSQGNDVKLRMFGTFFCKTKKERIGRNPKTLQEVKIPSRVVFKFKTAPSFKNKVNMNIKNFRHCMFNV